MAAAAPVAEVLGCNMFESVRADAALEEADVDVVEGDDGDGDDDRAVLERIEGAAAAAGGGGGVASLLLLPPLDVQFELSLHLWASLPSRPSLLVGPLWRYATDSV